MIGLWPVVGTVRIAPPVPRQGASILLSELVPAQGEQFGLKVDLSVLDQAHHRPEVFSGISNAVSAASDIVLVTLQDIDHGCCGADSAKLLHRFRPGAGVCPQARAQEASSRHEIGRIPDGMGITVDHGAGFDDQGRQRQMRLRRIVGCWFSVVLVALVTSLTRGFFLCLNVPECRAVTACLIKRFLSELSHLAPGIGEPGR